jgi:protein-tyrosine phosphatase
LFFKAIVVECIRGKGNAGVLIACYLMALWQVPPDYIVNHLRLIRPIALETLLQEQQLIDFHKTLTPTQRHFYAEIDKRHSWDIDTSYLNTTPLATPQQLSLA